MICALEYAIPYNNIKIPQKLDNIRDHRNSIVPRLIYGICVLQYTSGYFANYNSVTSNVDMHVCWYVTVCQVPTNNHLLDLVTMKFDMHT